LDRLNRSGIPSPVVKMVRGNVLAMSFIGHDGYPAPQLKTASFASKEQLNDCYVQCVRMVRTMYQKAHLVHADLSEYNLLYLKNTLYMIDVAQSVEHDVPNALEYLRRDCSTISGFFHHKGSHPMLTVREFFEFVTDLTVDESTEASHLESMLDASQLRSPLTQEQLVDDQVFQHSYIPRTLFDVIEPLEELDFYNNPDRKSDVFHHTVTGFNAVIRNEAPDSNTTQSDGEEDSSSENDDLDEDFDESDIAGPSQDEPVPEVDLGKPMTKEEAKTARKQAKKAFKQRKRDDRANKHQKFK